MFEAYYKALEALVRVVDMSAVTGLSFHFCSTPIQPIAGIIAAALQLHTLRLYREIDDESATAIAAALQHVPSLNALHLSGCMLRPDGAVAIAGALVNVQQLHTLTLDGNRIGHAGASAIAAAFQHVSQLHKLTLGSNQIGDAGTSAIAVALQHVPQLNM
jgi:Ran GTPase-activating protein (RanGAP) involved in mRNA processing and transport